MPEVYLSDHQIAKRYDIHRLTHRRWPDFPKPVKLSPGCVRWRLSDLEAWEQARSENAA